ncbi:hypothetical protein CP49_40045 [Bradyrhizobium valentinum]|uniref:Uncharacterized protein n=1 Tax=Bradyrhizobium valentinum TaxID=1518501 RepID=A0A0R3LQ09_9BRAD|nr:hypothetical protein CP49_40045 [Bradyrhizobium valentinum]
MVGSFRNRRFCHQGELSDELAAPSQLAGYGHVLQFGLCLLESFLRMLEQGGGAMQMKQPRAALCSFEIVQDLRLHCRTEPLGLLDPVLLGSCFQFVKRGDAKILVEAQDLVRAQPRHGSNSRTPCGNLLPNLSRAGFCAQREDLQ